jgi:cobalamin biosynthesis protein CobD/CbiB
MARHNWLHRLVPPLLCASFLGVVCPDAARGDPEGFPGADGEHPVKWRVKVISNSGKPLSKAEVVIDNEFSRLSALDPNPFMGATRPSRQPAYDRQRALTDGNGECSFTVVPGSFDVAVSRKGYYSYQAQLGAQRANATEIVLNKQPSRSVFDNLVVLVLVIVLGWVGHQRMKERAMRKKSS